MDPEEIKWHEENGHRIMDVEDWLDLSDEERKILDFRVTLAKRFRELRQSRKLTQMKMGVKLKMTQATIAKIEGAMPGVSLERMLRGFFAAGGDLGDLMPRKAAKKKTSPKKRVQA
jgi:DNA-binding XRE family transcriptional regulator